MSAAVTETDCVAGLAAAGVSGPVVDQAPVESPLLALSVQHMLSVDRVHR